MNKPLRLSKTNGRPFTLLSSKDVKNLSKTISEVLPTQYDSVTDLIEEVNKNIRFSASQHNIEAINPSKSNYKKIVACSLLNAGNEVVVSPNGDLKVGNTIISDSDIHLGFQDLSNKLKIRKTATILPDISFVKKLAKKAHDFLLKSKPKDPSKTVASMIHTMFFDYAMDKNIYLASAFYYELRNTYKKSLKQNFGLDDIKYYASDKRDEKIMPLVSSMLEGSLNSNKFVATIKNLYKELPVRNVCDRVILLGELQGLSEDQLMVIAERLNKETKLEFNFE